MSCPHLLVLSQLADGELPAEEAAIIASHVGGCDACRGRLGRLTRALGAASAAARTASAAALAMPARAPGGCPEPSLLAGWTDPAVPTPDRNAVARHLELCDACLVDAIGAARMLRRMDATPPVPVPAELRARVDALLAPRTADEGALSRLVIRVGRAGVALIESHLLAPLRELVELPAPAPALRGDAPAAGALSFKLHAPDAVISATVSSAGDGVGLTLRIEDADGVARPDERVFLRRHGRSLYSARTGPDGVLRMPGVERGVYEVACPGVGTTFRLDLRE